MSDDRTSAGTPINRCYRLRRRPGGSVTEADLEFAEEPVPAIEVGQALIRTLWLSIDPANRIWMSEIHYNVPPVAVDEVMRGYGVGEILESRREDMKAGDLVLGLTGWQDYVVADDERNDVRFTVLPSPLPAAISCFSTPARVTVPAGVANVVYDTRGKLPWRARRASWCAAVRHRPGSRRHRPLALPPARRSAARRARATPASA